MEEILNAAGTRLQSLLKYPDGTEATKAYNAAIGDAVDLLFRMAEAAPGTGITTGADTTQYLTWNFPVSLPDVPDRLIL